jgi:hypothetical protein
MVRSPGQGSDDACVPASFPSRQLRALFGFFAILLWLACASSAEAQVQTTIVGETSLQSLADGFLVPGPPGEVRVVVSACPSDASAQGCHSSGRAMDTIWLNPATGGMDDETFAHEMGHVFESYMWDLYWQQQARFVPRMFHRIVPLLDLPQGPGILSTTAWTERFAEAYSLCARQSAISTPVSTGYWGFETTPERHASTCALIDAMGSGYQKALPRGRGRR